MPGTLMLATKGAPTDRDTQIIIIILIIISSSSSIK